VGDVSNLITAGQGIDVTGAPSGWSGHYTVASTTTSAFKVTGLPLHLASRAPACGAVATSGYVETFTLAGGDGVSADTTHPFYTLHADFLQSWQQAPLQKLEDDWRQRPVRPEAVRHRYRSFRRHRARGRWRGRPISTEQRGSLRLSLRQMDPNRQHARRARRARRHPAVKR
jgi:hypothetical protein